MGSPPLYYVYAALPYLATYPLDFFDREFAMRLANIPLLLVLVALTWAIAGVLLPRRSLQLLATAAVALNPQLTHLAAVVNPDLFLATLWAAFFYLAIIVVTRGPTRGRVAGIAALSVASCLTHGRGIAIVVPAAFVFVAGVVAMAPAEPAHRRRLARRRGDRRAGRRLLASCATRRWAPDRGQHAPVRVLRLAVLSPEAVVHDAELPAHWTVRDAFIDRFYGTFAQLEVYFSPGVMTLWRA